MLRFPHPQAGFLRFLAIGVCLLALSFAGSAQAAVLAITGATFSPAPTGAVDNTTDITSFTTSDGTNTDLGGVASVNGIITQEKPPTPDSGVRNIWGFAGSEIDGPNAALGLDVGHGFSNLKAGDLMFGAATSGVPGLGNDIFIIEIGGNDNFTVLALDGSGAVIGTPLNITVSQWGNVGTDLTFNGDNATNNGNFGPATANLAGVGIDLVDLGVVSGSVAGIRISGTSSNNVDLMAAGYTIPEPASICLVGLAAATMLIRRRAN